MRLRNLRGTGASYLLLGAGLNAAADIISQMPPDASARELRGLAAKKGIKFDIEEAPFRGMYIDEVFTHSPGGRMVATDRRIVAQRLPSDRRFDRATFAHELGHAEGWWGSGPRSKLEVYYRRTREPIFMASVAAAGAVKSPRIRKALLLGAVPNVAEEALASYRGAKILHKEGKLKKRHVLMLTTPVIDRVAKGAILYGAGKGSRALFEYVRGYVRRQNGKRINVSSYFRRIRGR